MTVSVGVSGGRSGPSRRVILALVLLAQLMVVLDATIVTVALPRIESGLHFGSQLSLQWVINAYLLGFGGFLLLGGRAGDLYGRRTLLVLGLALFTAASLANGLAQSPGLLIAGRAVQGLGGALVAPAVLSIIVAMQRNFDAVGRFAHQARMTDGTAVHPSHPPVTLRIPRRVIQPRPATYP